MRSALLISALLAATPAPVERSLADCIPLLASEDKGVADAARQQLADAWTDALPMLTRALEHVDEHTPVRNICMLLRRLGPDAASAADALAKTFASRWNDRWYLAIALAHVAPDRASPLADRLSECARGDWSGPSALCREALLHIGGPESVPFLLEGLADPDPHERALTARYARDAPPERVRDALIKALHDREIDVRVSAASSLVRFPSEAPANAFATLMKGVCHGNGFNLGLVGRTLNAVPTVAAQAEERLVLAILGTNAECRRRAAAALAYIRPNRAIPAMALLREALRSEDSDVRSTTALALANMGVAAREALPELEALLADRSADLRTDGAVARKQIESPPLAFHRIQDLRLAAVDPRATGQRVAQLVNEQGQVWQVVDGQRLLDGVVDTVTLDSVWFQRTRVSDDLQVTNDRVELCLFGGSEAPRYPQDEDHTGHRVSVDFDGDIATFVWLVANISGLDASLERGTRGRVRVAARDSPWDRIVLDGLESAGLGYRLDQNYLRIATRERAAQIQLLPQEPWTGHKVSFTLLRWNIDLLERTFREISGLTIQFPADDEPISLFANEAPWDQLFELVLASRGWTRRIEGSVVTVVPSPESSSPADQPAPLPDL